MSVFEAASVSLLIGFLLGMFCQRYLFGGHRMVPVSEGEMLAVSFTAVLFFLTVWLVLFAGEPDLLDALIQRATP